MAKYVIWSNGNKVPFSKISTEFHIAEEAVEGWLGVNYPELEIVSDEVAPAPVPELTVPVESGDEEPKPKKSRGDFFSKDSTTQKGVNE